MPDNEELEKLHSRSSEHDKYTKQYPIPDALEQHNTDNPNACNIQVVGCFKAGKSTFLKELLKEAGSKQTAEMGSKQTTFYEITDKITGKPERYDKVFLCDQPGIGGLNRDNMDDGLVYFSKFGPGKLNFNIHKGFIISWLISTPRL